MKIRPISLDDLPELIALQGELIDEDGDISKMNELLPVLLRDGNYHLIGAYRSGRLIGSLVGIVCHDLFGKCVPFMVVENVVVTKSARNTGVGTILMKNIESIAMNKNCRFIMLISAAERTNAKNFYQALGYDSDPYRGYKKILSR
jgi:GNAT superfamily N-acetyltransferase